MARAARYGNIPPSDYEEMDYEEGAELSRLVTEMHIADVKMIAELHTELTKATIKSLAGRVM